MPRLGLVHKVKVSFMASSAKALELKVELCAGAQCGAHVNTTQYVVCGVQLA